MSKGQVFKNDDGGFVSAFPHEQRRVELTVGRKHGRTPRPS